MKIIQSIGMTLFLGALVLFTSSTFLSKVEFTKNSVKETVNENVYKSIGSELSDALQGTFSNPIKISGLVSDIYNKKNQKYKEAKEWDKVMYVGSGQLTYQLIKKNTVGWFVTSQGLLLFLTFGLGVIGALMYIIPQVVTLGPAGIKNNHVYQNPSTNRGWIAWLVFVYLVGFYVLLYFNPQFLVSQIQIVEPIKEFISGGESSQWFLYGVLYCTVMTVMGIRMIIKYRHNNYQIVRTLSVIFFQLIFAFLLVEILPLFNMPAVDLKNAWPLDYDFLFDWNVKQLFEYGNVGKFVFFWGILLSVIIVPTLVYFYGKRWYCSWVCGCGGLAETLGDPYRQHSDKSIKAWKFERYIIHGVLVFAIVMTAWTGYHTYNVLNASDSENVKASLLGISVFDIRSWYGFLIGSIFSGVIGTGFYPIFGNRVWCRFGCPLAAYMGLVQRFKSRFRITTNGAQCISCGNCSTYCEQGIDVRAYAQKGQNIVRSSCVGCGVCAAVCPRGVLKLENGPEEGRINDDPIMIGNEGVKLNYTAIKAK